MSKNDKRRQLLEQIESWHKENEEKRIVFAILAEKGRFTSTVETYSTDALINIFLNIMEEKEVADIILKAALAYTIYQKRAKRDPDNADSN